MTRLQIEQETTSINSKDKTNNWLIAALILPIANCMFGVVSSNLFKVFLLFETWTSNFMLINVLV